MKWSIRLQTGANTGVYKELFSWDFYWCHKTTRSTTEKQFYQQRAYFSLYLKGYTPSLREVRTETQDRNLELGTDA